MKAGHLFNKKNKFSSSKYKRVWPSKNVSREQYLVGASEDGMRPTQDSSDSDGEGAGGNG